MASTKALISVVTISFNHEKYLRDALDSILSQKRESKFELEVIVADDASTDNTPEIIHQYHLQHPKIIKPILRKKNVGIQNNLIDALRHTKGDYVALCEGDDFWESELKLLKQFKLMQRNKNLSLSFHPTRVFFDDGKFPDTIFPAEMKEYTVANLLSENFIPTNSVVYRKCDYDTLKNDLMPFDWYLHAFHLKSGGQIGFLPETMSAYRRHAKGAWWSSHKDTTKFWSVRGPEMLRILSEFRTMFNSNPDHLKSIAEGEFKVAAAMARSKSDIASHLQSEISKNKLLDRFSAEYANTLQETEILSAKLATNNERLKQAKREIKLLRKDLSYYITTASDLSKKYDLLRSDLKNPVKLFHRILKHRTNKR